MDDPRATSGPSRTRGSRPRTSRRWPPVDYLRPAGVPALYSPDSITWHVFKNPVALFVGGITAVLLELAEPRVRSGVWGHSIFPDDPITRLRRTGHVTHVCVYAPRPTAEQVIASVVRMHERVRGTTPDGAPYHANEPELLDWVQVTASYGFLEAYTAYCHPLTEAQRDRFYGESVASAALFGATGAPRSLAQQREHFEAMRPRLEPHPIVRQFLDIMARAPALPRALAGLQALMLRAAVDRLPGWVIDRLELRDYALRERERRLLHAAGHLFERVPLPGSPPVQASRRLGLPATHLYWGRGRP